MSQKKRTKGPAAARTQASTPGPDPRSTPSITAPASSAAVLEDLEPEVDSSTMPAWLFIAMILLAYWGMLHLDRYGGGFSERVYAPYQSQRQLADFQLKSGPELLVAKGQAMYALMCLVCHQSSGVGSPGLYPPLAGSEWVTGSANRLIRIPLHGLTGPIEVKGQTWKGLNMPAFGTSPPLDNDENLAAVLTYIRQAWGNQAPPITPEQVAAVRSETASRTRAWTADELQRIPE